MSLIDFYFDPCFPFGLRYHYNVDHCYTQGISPAYRVDFVNMDQFVRADSANLPKLDNLMILEYMSTNDKHNVAEIRGAKILMSSRDSYVDTAVGYVEVKRSQSQCIVRAKVVPEHRVAVKQYVVTVTINESSQEIIETACDGCAAAAGGCKHTLVVLYWLDKRSNEPASTSVQCYWKKPSLSNIKSEPVLSENIFRKCKKIKLTPKDADVLPKFLEECESQNVSHSLATCFTKPRVSYNIFDLTIEYLREEPEDFEKFITFLNKKMSPDVIEEIYAKTKSQAHSKLWHSIRQGRITASKIYDASRCSTDGTLVEQILGGYKVPETEAIKRGKKLEQEQEKTLNEKICQSGFMLIDGVMGASPDGVGPDFVLEVKCPSTKKTMKNYVSNGKINNKYIAQMQTQMLALKKAKAVFCVADPEFEKNKSINLYWISYDAQYVNDLMSKALTFWKMYVYKKIISSAQT